MLSKDDIRKRKIKINKLISSFKKLFPQTKIALTYSNNWELLVAVILSAQCTDKKVNEVTVELFKKYRTLEDYIRAKPEDFARDIKSIGLYRGKTKSILETAKVIKEKFGGKIPKTMKEILTLRGVARKTANVVLGNAYGIVEGIAVDTHVMRLSKLFGLTDHGNPVKIEKDLMQILPKSEWFDFTYRMIDYGRKYCTAKTRDHSRCPLKKFETSLRY